MKESGWGWGMVLRDLRSWKLEYHCDVCSTQLWLNCSHRRSPKSKTFAQTVRCDRGSIFGRIGGRATMENPFRRHNRWSMESDGCNSASGDSQIRSRSTYRSSIGWGSPMGSQWMTGRGRRVLRFVIKTKIHKLLKLDSVIPNQWVINAPHS